ncbi:MAG: nitronate monooxygenase [Deltaproteobacteria bacterium]|nr:nitronate monooxygenase [Deltaproteobacteria bacterium]
MHNPSAGNAPQANPLCRDAGIQVPILCGAMYPCSNWELVAAASAAGAMGIVQPIALVYAHGGDFRDSLRKIRAASGGKPFGMNLLIEGSSRLYLDRMRRWLDIALEEGVRFFVSSLGHPGWIVERVRPLGGVVYHDVTERKWGEKARDAGVHGLIAVNRRAGGHAGPLSQEQLIADLLPLGLPVVCAGGVGHEQEFVQALQQGYAGVQMGTRFIATHECSAHSDYKQAIVAARGEDVVLTDKISGVPVAVIKTPFVEAVGLKANPVAARLLRHPRGKHYMRLYYSLITLFRLKRVHARGAGYQQYFLAGKSVDGIQKVESVADVVARFARAAQAAGAVTGPTASAGKS